MKVLRAQVQNFRSIVDSEEIDLEERVSVLIGKNEQGKTNFLRGLASFNPANIYVPSDLPSHLRPTLEEKNPPEIPIVTLRLSSESSDMESLKEIIPDVDTVEEFKVRRYFDGHYEYWYQKTGEAGSSEKPISFVSPNIDPLITDIKVAADALKTKLAAHAQRVPPFEPSIAQAQTHIDQFIGANFNDVAQVNNLFKTFTTGLRNLPGQDQAIQEDIASTIKELQTKNADITQAFQKDPVGLFRQRLPHFVFHSTALDKVPNEVNIAEFIKDPEKTSKGMANLCAVAGLSTQKVQELANAPDAARREVYEDHYRATISGGLNEFWTQETYTFHFRIEKERLSVSISDNTYAPRIAPSDRSDGFQWYLSFYCALLSEVSTTDPTVLLLDNPGLELHADGQRDIKRFLEEKLPLATQVVYVTHSPAMIDPYNLEQVRKVELLGAMQGTKVRRLTIKEGEDFDLFEPVRSAIGASIVSSLILNEFNVLVEGAADKPILEGAFAALQKELSKKILINGSIAETKEGLLPRFYQRARFPFIVWLDGDARGRELAGLLAGWGIPGEKIVQPGSIFPEKVGHDFELEDLVSLDFYHDAVTEAYPECPLEKPTGETGKRTKYYERRFKELFKIGFNKRRVGEKVKKLLLEGKADAGTLECLRKVTDTIWETLKSQASFIERSKIE